MTADDPRPAGEDEYAGHGGSCRIFYAEHRCTCTPAPPVSQADGNRERLAAALAEHEPRYRSSFATGEDWFECGPEGGEERCGWQSKPESEDIGADHRLHIADALLPVVRALVAEGAATAVAEEREAAYWKVMDAADVWMSHDKRARASVVCDFLMDLGNDIKRGRPFRRPVAYAVTLDPK